MRAYAIYGWLALATLVPWQPPARADNWPQWRGPGGDGLCAETEVPVTWAEGSGIEWKCRLPEWGNSTPAIWGETVFVTSHVDDQRLVLLRIDKGSGRIVWSREVGRGSAPQATSPSRGRLMFHREHNLASPSPVTDGKTVVAHFGNGDLVAYDFDGRRLWHRNLCRDYGRYTSLWGHANSPVLVGDLVVSVCIQDPCDNLLDPPGSSYVVAHDKRTGPEVWKTTRTTGATRFAADSYVTPILRKADNRTELVVAGGEWLDAYDPATGKRLWCLPGLTGKELARSPVAAHGMIYTAQGLGRALLAIRPGGDGQRAQDDVAWTFGNVAWDVPSPVVCGGWLFLVDNMGIARCLDALTGEVLWEQRLRGRHRASPIAAGGRIYFLNTEGLTTVVSASANFEKLAENQLDDRTYASPAVSDGKIFIRGREWLYCIGR